MLGFERGIPLIERMDEVVKWMTLNQEPANFVLLYIYEPDSTAHQTGPFSPQVRSMLGELDNAVQHLVTRLNETDLLEETNLIILSDHGMSETREDNILDLTKLCDSGDFMAIGDTPNLNLFFYNKANIEKVYEQLLNASNRLPFTVWRTAEVPAEYHFSKHRRIGDLVLEANNGFDLVIGENPFEFNYFTAQKVIDAKRKQLDSARDGKEPSRKLNIIEKFDDFLVRKSEMRKKVAFQKT